MIQNTDPLHQLEGRERVGANAGRYPFRRIVVPQDDFRVASVEPGFQQTSPAQIEIRIEKQPYQSRIERPEYLPPVRHGRGPVMVNNIDEIGMMLGLVDEMVADRIADRTHDTWVTRDPAQDGGYQRL